MSKETSRTTLELLVLPGVGGFLGSILRYSMGTFMESLGAVLLANVLGSFLLGFTLYEEVHSKVIPHHLRFALSVGFLPSMTTFSAFVIGIFTHLEQALLIIFSNYTLSFLGIYVGRSLAVSSSESS